MLEYKEYSIEEIKAKWKELFNKKNTFNLYIDVPFCISICKFCNLGKIASRVNSKEYKEYFDDILPKFFEQQSDILRLKIFDTLYLGGGTSGMMDTHTMRKVFDLIPNIDKIESKKFEANPTILSKEKLEILSEYGFNQISMGVQSFNNDLIFKNNRIPVKQEKLRSIIDFCREHGISTNCDLLTFTEQSAYAGETVDVKASLKNTANDIKIMIENIKPDTITIYPKWEMFNYTDSSGFLEDKSEEDFKLRYNINKTILKIIRKHPEYKISSDKIELDLRNISREDAVNNIVLKLKKSKNIIEDRYDSSSYPFNKGNKQNVVGLGGYGGKKGRTPYSYIGNNFYYINVVENGEIKYLGIES